MLPIIQYENEIQDNVLLCEELLSSLKGTHLLITGAAGLIGSYLVDIVMAYNQWYNGSIRLTAIDSNTQAMQDRFKDYLESECFCAMIGDVSDANMLRRVLEPVDYIIHAASHTSPIEYASDPVGTMTANVLGTLNLLELARIKHAKRFLFCSSVEAYGRNNGDADDFDELYSGYVDCNTLRAAYPSAKRASESLCCAFHNQYGVDYAIARIGRIFGPTVYLNDTKAPTQFILNAAQKQDIVLKSDGMQHFSYGYVFDCVTAFLTILVKGTCGEAYNVANPDGKIRLKEFALYAAQAAGTRLQFQNPNAMEKKGYSQITKATMDTRKLVALGWQARYSTEEGITRTVAYLKTLLEDSQNV